MQHPVQLTFPGFSRSAPARACHPTFRWLERQADAEGRVRDGSPVLVAWIAQQERRSHRSVKRDLLQLRLAGLITVQVAGRRGVVVVVKSPSANGPDSGPDSSRFWPRLAIPIAVSGVCVSPLKSKTCHSEKLWPLNCKTPVPPSEPPIQPQASREREKVLEKACRVMEERLSLSTSPVQPEPEATTAPKPQPAVERHGAQVPVETTARYDPRPGWRWFQDIYPHIRDMDAAARAWISVVEDEETERGVRRALAQPGVWFLSQQWADGVFDDGANWLLRKLWKGKPALVRSREERRGFSRRVGLARAMKKAGFFHGADEPGGDS